MAKTIPVKLEFEKFSVNCFKLSSPIHVLEYPVIKVTKAIKTNNRDSIHKILMAIFLISEIIEIKTTMSEKTSIIKFVSSRPPKTDPLELTANEIMKDTAKEIIDSNRVIKINKLSLTTLRFFLSMERSIALYKIQNPKHTNDVLKKSEEILLLFKTIDTKDKKDNEKVKTANIVSKYSFKILMILDFCIVQIKMVFSFNPYCFIKF